MALLSRIAISAELEGAISCETGTWYDSAASEDSVLSVQTNLKSVEQSLSFHWLQKQPQEIYFPKVKLAFMYNPYFFPHSV